MNRLGHHHHQQERPRGCADTHYSLMFMLVTWLVSQEEMGPYVELSVHCLLEPHGEIQLSNALLSVSLSPGEKVASASCTSIRHMRSEREMGVGGVIEGGRGSLLIGGRPLSLCTPRSSL